MTNTAYPFSTELMEQEPMTPADDSPLNADSSDAVAGTVGGVAGDILRAYVERIERLEEEKKAMAADIREIYLEAKGNGYDPKIMRKLIALRKMEQADRQEEEELLDVYRRAIGMM